LVDLIAHSIYICTLHSELSFSYCLIPISSVKVPY